MRVAIDQRGGDERAAEIDLLEALGESNLPEPLQPVGYLLT